MKSNYEMQFFKKKEFYRDGVDWYPKLSEELKIKLDLFRFRVGTVQISPHKDAVGRDDLTDSQHNINKWGEVRAVDVMPTMIKCYETMLHALEMAQECGFKGIGIYPDWAPYPGLHLDVRHGRNFDDPAIWAAIEVDRKQKFVSLDEALHKMDWTYLGADKTR